MHSPLDHATKCCHEGTKEDGEDGALDQCGIGRGSSDGCLSLAITVDIDLGVIGVGECGVRRRLQVHIGGRSVGTLTNGLEGELGVVVERSIESIADSHVNSDFVNIVL